MNPESGTGETDGRGSSGGDLAPHGDNQQILDPFEIRVLAVLAEKESLTPDNYPLSINALVNGCNQLSSRDPVMSVSEQTIHDVLHRLMQKKLVAEVGQAGARVAKYEHRMRVRFSLPQDKLAVLTMLMLRGTQTPGEIRARAGRLHEFPAVADVEACLQFLMDKFPPLIARLARAPGTKESRYAHLLSGEEILEQQEVAALFAAKLDLPASRQDRTGDLQQEMARLRAEVESLQRQFDEFKKQFD